MSNALISKRYAEALFQLAEEKKITEAMESELLIVQEVFQQNQNFVLFLENPAFDGNKKKQLIDEAFRDFSQEVLNTLKLLVDRHHEEIVPEIVDAFVAFVNKAKAIQPATVYSVRALSEQEQEQLADVFQEKLHIANIKLKNVIDPDLIGGVKLRIGNTVYDGSVKGKLERIEKNIVVTK